MNLSDIKNAGDFAKNYGVKTIIYGPPGSAKTPLVATCPRPLLLSCEAGLLGMRGSKVPTYQAFTTDSIEEFFTWWFGSNDNKNFDTLAIDSGSQIADIYLQDIFTGKSKSGNKMHGQAAYGKMAEECMKHFRKLYVMEYKHIYLIAKENDVGGMKRPYFPGNVLNVEVPHCYDFIIHTAKHNVPAQPQHNYPAMGQILTFQCNQTIDILARNRTGNLADYEPPHFGQLIAKAMG